MYLEACSEVLVPEEIRQALAKCLSCPGQIIETPQMHFEESQTTYHHPVLWSTHTQMLKLTTIQETRLGKDIALTVRNQQKNNNSPSHL